MNKVIEGGHGGSVDLYLPEVICICVAAFASRIVVAFVLPCKGCVIHRPGGALATSRSSFLWSHDTHSLLAAVGN